MKFDKMIFKTTVRPDKIKDLQTLLHESLNKTYYQTTELEHEIFGLTLRSDGSIRDTTGFGYENPEIIVNGLAPFMNKGNLIFLGSLTGDFREFYFDGDGKVKEFVIKKEIPT